MTQSKGEQEQMAINNTENINTWLSHLHEETKFSISVDCVIFGYDEAALKVLLMDCNMPPYEGKKSLIGDLLQKQETTDEAAKRILENRTLLTDLYLEQVNVYSNPFRHPLGRVITLAYYSLINIEDYENQIVDAENKQLEWKTLATIDDLAFDHLEIVKDAYARLQRTVREVPIGFSMLPKKFSLIQLQNFYETVLDIELDRRNFRRKLMALGLLIDLKEFQDNVAHRPAKLYSFDFEKYKQKKNIGTLNFEI